MQMARSRSWRRSNEESATGRTGAAPAMGSGIKGVLDDGWDRLVRWMLEAVTQFQADLVAGETKAWLR
jgi:hypothetical protein